MGTFCDACMMTAYAEGFNEAEDQRAFLEEASEALGDHPCDRLDNPDAGIKCECLAHS